MPMTAADSCGDVDGQGISRFTLCKDPSSHVFWDAVHPVESTWKHVVDLYYNETGFVIGATTLESWLSQNGLRIPDPAHVPGKYFVEHITQFNLQISPCLDSGCG